MCRYHSLNDTKAYIVHQIKPFLDDNFLLENGVAEKLYHDFAKAAPIIDYHCHLPPDEIAADKQFESLTEIWLKGDHYKWRAMRTFGISENYITGPTSDWEKMEKWALTVPNTIGNPLYHWTHLELKRYFGFNGVLNPSTAKQVYHSATELLAQKEFSTRNLLRKMNVKVVCTTDDPIDDLRYHRQLKEESFDIPVFPAFRPDKSVLIEREAFVGYIEQLGHVAGTHIVSFGDLLYALYGRMDYFQSMGCCVSDHGLEQVYAADFTDDELDRIFRKRMQGQVVYPAEALVYQSGLLHYLFRAYHERGWVQQLHLGAMRNNSSRMARTLGPDTGFDSIGDYDQARPLSRFLDKLDTNDQLAKTILYNLNPRDNEVFATMIGNFNDGSYPGKIQWGSGWWFLDQKDGMQKQLTTLANMSLLSTFVGMLTDSRSFLSFPRHEYFRRILCNLIGKDVSNGELPYDIELLGQIVSDICFNNAKKYFNFPTI